MATRAPLYASIPYSALPCASTSSTRQPEKTVDELLDDLDSDSGFSDDAESEPVLQDPQDKGDEAAQRVNSSTAPLQDAPSLFPQLANASASSTSASPPWLAWTSSRVTCSDAVYGSNEDKIDCIWLILGCLDGSVWIFCSLVLTGAGVNTPVRNAGLRSSSQPNLLQSLNQRPGITRKGSDFGVKRGGPTSPIATTSSRLGSSSMSPSRTGSTVHGHSHTRKNRSISLALRGSSGLSGTATPGGQRKASATISVSDFDATGNESLDKDLPSPPKSPSDRHSPSIHGSERPSFSFEELAQLEKEKLDYSKLSFEPVARVHPDAQHSPIKSVKLLQPEGSTTPFLGLTENGCLYKLSCLDGTLLARQDLRPSVFPRTSAISFDRMLASSGDEKRVLITTNGSGVLAASTADLGILSNVPVEPHSHFATMNSTSGLRLLEIRTNGHICVLEPDDNKPQAESVDAGQVLEADEKAMGMRCSGENIVIWQSSAVKVLRLAEGKAQIVTVLDSKNDIEDVVILSAQRLGLVSKNSVRIVSIEKRDDEHILLDFKISETILSASVFTPPATTDDCLVLTTEDSDGTRNICLAPLANDGISGTDQPDIIVAFNSNPQSVKPAAIVTASVCPDNRTIALGSSEGQVAFSSITQAGLTNTFSSDVGLGYPVTCMLGIIDDNGSHIVYAGTADGQVAALETGNGLKHRSTHSLFTSPVLSLQQCDAGLLAIAADGSLAVLAQAQDESWTVLLVYAHGLARLWDIDSGTMQKSMDHSGVVSLLSHMDGWTEVTIDDDSTKPAHTLNLRSLVESAAAATAKGSRTSEERLNPMIRWLISLYCPEPGEDYVRKALEDLQISLSASTACSANAHTMAMYPSSNALTSYAISQKLTARRLLTLVALLRIFLNFADTERAANEVIAYYSTQLEDLVGPTYKDASLQHLADFWLDESIEIRQAARLLFGARIGRLEESEIYLEVQERQARILQATSVDPKELLILGEIAIAKRDLLSSGTVRDIAYNIAQSLDNSDDPACQHVSLELCIRGFSTFQNSFDAVKVLRSIFALATSSLTDVIAIGLRNLARQAVLSVAAVNAPLFMTVLSFDAVHNEADTDERARTMKLVAFMVRKKPIVLFSSLPRLAEMVVRSLDPRGNLRGVLQQTATFILSELVKTYPSIAFHGKSQRLAVGTHEGAVVVYDLKTATRLYVLESHHKRASAVSYSPDGRRLVTVSLEESNVKVWKVGASLLGLLTPAGPPPQGHGSSSNEAYKTLDFKLASPEEAMMTAAAQLEWLTVEWSGERGVKITIRETALTFSVA